MKRPMDEVENDEEPNIGYDFDDMYLFVVVEFFLDYGFHLEALKHWKH